MNVATIKKIHFFDEKISVSVKSHSSKKNRSANYTHSDEERFTVVYISNEKGGAVAVKSAHVS